MFASLILAAAIGAAKAAPTASPEPVPTLSPRQLLGQIRAVFRSHRPPRHTRHTRSCESNSRRTIFPITRTATRSTFGCANSDRAALSRFVFRDFARGDLTFDRPAFNEDRIQATDR